MKIFGGPENESEADRKVRLQANAQYARDCLATKVARRAKRLDTKEMLEMASHVLCSRIIKLGRQKISTVTKDDQKLLLELTRELNALSRRIGEIDEHNRKKTAHLNRYTKEVEEEKEELPTQTGFTPGRVIQPANGANPTVSDPV